MFSLTSLNIMNCELNSTQALWLGYLHYTAALQMPLSAYADEHDVSLAELMAWEKRVIV
tara:strand:- start:829 stop:1005 length:177 start_codon:yes stop_codon:yes gene_type:complete